MNSENQELCDKVSLLEKKCQEQDNELICLKSALSDALRRIHTLESNPNPPQNTNRIASSSTKTTSKPTFNHQHPKTPRSAVPPSVTNKSMGDSVPKFKLREKEPTQKEQVEGAVKIFIRGRPVVFYGPSSYGADPTQTFCNQPTDKKLQIDWVYGYRGKDTRQNLFLLNSGEVAYFTAAVAVLHDVASNKQRHYLGHTDDIKCMALHPDKETMATGQVAGHEKKEGKPHVRVWNSVTLETLKIIGLADFERGVACLSFSKTDGGQQLAVVDESNDHILSLWEWGKGDKGSKILETKSSVDQVLLIEFNQSESNQLVTCGKNHIIFWTVDNNNISKKNGIFEKVDKPKYVTSLNFTSSGNVISGDSNGSILIWKNNKIQQAITNAHEGGVFCIHMTKNGFISGGKDHNLVAWDTKEDQGDGVLFEKNGEENKLPENMGSVRKIIDSGDGELIVGTIKNFLLKGKIKSDFALLLQSHTEEVWGLSLVPSSSSSSSSSKFYVTCGHDKMLFLWDLEKKIIVFSREMPEPCHAVSAHPFLPVVVVTTNSPKCYMVTLETMEVMTSFGDASERVECLEFSPDGSKLACGSRDNFIYIYNVSEDGTKYNKLAKLQGHSSFVLHLDWSEDGQYLQSNSGDYELLMWNISTMKQVLSGSQLRDTLWSTSNCVLSFSSCGIWPEGADGTDINACTRSHNNQLLATADDYGKVNLYNYPCFHPKSQGQAGDGHSSHVTNVKFSQDSSVLLSSGGKDASIIQWRVV